MIAPFNKKIGILGGGQLGKMLIEAGAPWNLNYTILEQADLPPAKAQNQIKGTLYEADKIRELVENSDVTTWEIEHLDVSVLKQLEAEGNTIIPSPSVLEIIQNKGTQKQFYADNNIPCGEFKVLGSIADLRNTITNNAETVVIKSCTGGYDGKGVWITTGEKIHSENPPFEAPFLWEGFVENATEIAVMVASDGSNQVSYPAVEMVFDPVANLVDYLVAPVINVTTAVEQEARALAEKVAAAFNSPGLYAIEFLYTPQTGLIVNETAPRPHNSGHHTIEACRTSQFEQLNRILCGLPLGNTDLIEPACMVNLLGSPNVEGDYQWKGMDSLMAKAGAYVHLYDKAQTRPGRKMGHFTVMNPNVQEAVKDALELKNTIYNQENE